MGIPSNSISSTFLPQRHYQKYFSSHIQIVVSVLNTTDEGYIVACLIRFFPTEGDRCYQSG